MKFLESSHMLTAHAVSTPRLYVNSKVKAAIEIHVGFPDLLSLVSSSTYKQQAGRQSTTLKLTWVTNPGSTRHDSVACGGLKLVHRIYTSFISRLISVYTYLMAAKAFPHVGTSKVNKNLFIRSSLVVIQVFEISRFGVFPPSFSPLMSAGHHFHQHILNMN